MFVIQSIIKGGNVDVMMLDNIMLWFTFQLLLLSVIIARIYIDQVEWYTAYKHPVATGTLTYKCHPIVISY